MEKILVGTGKPIGKCTGGRIYKSGEVEILVKFNKYGTEVLKQINKKKGRVFFDMRMELAPKMHSNEQALIKNSKLEFLEVSIVEKKKKI